jgi:hypothetical protein
MPQQKQPMCDDDLQQILAIAKWQADTLEHLKTALLAGDEPAALEVARKLVGLEEPAEEQ